MSAYIRDQDQNDWIAPIMDLLLINIEQNYRCNLRISRGLYIYDENGDLMHNAENVGGRALYRVIVTDVNRFSCILFVLRL